MKKPTLPKAESLQSEDTPSCDAHLVHLDRVRQVQPEIISVEKAQQMAEFFNALADPSRLRLMSALVNRELCVCDLAAAVKMGESAVSHQLRILRSQRLVKYYREGRNIYYSLADNHVMSLYQEVSEHLKEANT
ncbi:transcriptional regulator [Fischerella thermalis CCMEE 5273]|uniref:Transcriptional regulator n=1 Tax=Chlorogloeopsis fritschii PCC 6912 TaxID=211165 RepID=A0A433NLB9_CHLFR|nr:metalloregulator ArsR/SmtB family transcription factor [Chlorogloeopsis fritschii]PMB09466.1 transcriptional regulator [Fischerella thermalis CCMEE 5273]PMB50410.1 transcriptional regulator [Fischerella thermalis CCMEE 5205]RUR83724.1 transcriptional regulator [Chlorogloeopsis fritschii PCC 6912]